MRGHRSRRLTSIDIGAWLFRCNPRSWADGRSVDGWCALPTYRLELIEPAQPAVLWVTGSRGAEPEPGIWMAGFTTGEIDPGRDGRRPYVGLRMAGLQAPVPRERLQADRRTDRLEVLRVAHGSNPSYLTPEEKAAVEEMIGGWPDPIGGADAWCRPAG